MSYALKSKCSFVLNIQLAKLAGNKVVATCGGESKSMFLTSLGVDRVINYQSEKIKDVSFGSCLSYLSFIL
jgi:NADPH-dependent curcumin reductase CurA